MKIYNITWPDMADDEQFMLEAETKDEALESARQLLGTDTTYDATEVAESG